MRSCTQPLTVTATSAVREEGREKDRTRSKTKGPWRLPISYFLCALLRVIRRGCECQYFDKMLSTGTHEIRICCPRTRGFTVYFVMEHIVVFGAAPLTKSTLTRVLSCLFVFRTVLKLSYSHIIYLCIFKENSETCLYGIIYRFIENYRLNVMRY